MAQKKDSVNVSVEDLQTALVSAVTTVTSVFASLNQRAGTSSASGTSSKSKHDDIDDDDFQQRPLNCEEWVWFLSKASNCCKSSHYKSKNGQY